MEGIHISDISDMSRDKICYSNNRDDQVINMKRTAIFMMPVISVLCVGCDFEKRDRVRDVGVPELITENDIVTVLSAEIG